MTATLAFVNTPAGKFPMKTDSLPVVLVVGTSSLGAHPQHIAKQRLSQCEFARVAP